MIESERACPRDISPAWPLEDCPAFVALPTSRPVFPHRTACRMPNLPLDTCMLMPVSEILAARGALRHCTNLETVSDDRSKVFRIFQSLESLPFVVHDVPLQVLSVFHCSWSVLSSTWTTTFRFSTSSTRFNFSGSPYAMMSSP